MQDNYQDSGFRAVINSYQVQDDLLVIIRMMIDDYQDAG